ncbi:MAG: MGMT family protein [Candidatus Omnitrophota bacterium]|nr:MAG: MGMT family protein [Candidatus Omnitrophota bacterium]
MKNRPEKYTITLTEFQNRVYKEVSKIPKGKVRSYKYIACKIEKPNAWRAVANALKKNPFIGKVPCHRVIKSDGAIGGFSRGVNAKKKLLRAEGLTIKGNAVIINGDAFQGASLQHKKW